jgi:hypothetical protein
MIYLFLYLFMCMFVMPQVDIFVKNNNETCGERDRRLWCEAEDAARAAKRQAK